MFSTSFKYRILIATLGPCLLGGLLSPVGTPPLRLPVVYAAATNFRFQLLITDDHGMAVPGATIQVSAPGMRPVSTTTDEHGRTTLNLPAGIIELTVSKSGFITMQTTATVSASATPTLLKIVLTESPVVRQEVTVRATPSDLTAESASSPATLAPEQAKLTPARPATLTDALPIVPGVIRTPDGLAIG